MLSVPTVYREPKGIYVLESLAAGVPVVLPEHGAFPELLADLEGGRLVPPNDPAALALQLHALLVDPDERHRLGQRGQERVCSTRSDAVMARQTLAVWNRIPGRAGRTS